MKIRAAILEEMGGRRLRRSRPLIIDDVELAPPGPGEVLVKIAAAGLCHSDLSVIDGSRPRPMPMLIGHEAAARVVETGADVDGLARGDHVVIVFVPSCAIASRAPAAAPRCEPAAAANAAGTLLSGAWRITRREALLHHHPLGVGLRRICNGVAALAGQGRPRRGARACRSVRLRRADRGRRGRQPARDRGLDGCRGRSRRRRTGGAAGRRRRGRERAPYCARSVAAEARDRARARGDRQLRGRCRRQPTGAGGDPRRRRLALEMAGSLKALELPTGSRGVAERRRPPGCRRRRCCRCRRSVSSPRSAHSRGSYRHVRALARSAALSRALPPGTAAGRPAAAGRLTLDQVTEGFDRLREGTAVRQIIAFG